LHETWSLPAAFVYAGARAVIASAAPIPDAEAGEFFDHLRDRVQAGAPVAVALRDARQQWISLGRGEWVRDVIVFE
jgi:CHAT domain-containing protein